MTLTVDDVAAFFLALEGPYKWYVLGAILVLLTAVMTRVIFKTFKWFLLLAAVAIIAFTLVYYFAPDFTQSLVGEEGASVKVEKLVP